MFIRHPNILGASLLHRRLVRTRRPSVPPVFIREPVNERPRTLLLLVTCVNKLAVAASGTARSRPRRDPSGLLAPSPSPPARQAPRSALIPKAPQRGSHWQRGDAPHRARPRRVAPGGVRHSGLTNEFSPEILHVPVRGPRPRLVGALHEVQQSSFRRVGLAQIVVHQERHTAFGSPERRFRT